MASELGFADEVSTGSSLGSSNGSTNGYDQGSTAGFEFQESLGSAPALAGVPDLSAGMLAPDFNSIIEMKLALLKRLFPTVILSVIPTALMLTQ